MLKRLLFSLLMISALVAPPRSNAQYNEPKPVKRVALVIGNADYENADKLPGSVTDARTMAQNLRDAGFDVTLGENVKTRDDFLGLVLPFVAKIDHGSFAVMYFSGHGFTFGGEGFLTPTTFPKTVLSTEVQDIFLSVTGLQDLANSRNPALLLMLLDACRNVPNFVVAAPDGSPGDVRKGFPEFARNPNNVLGYASREGTVSIGDGTGGLSKYTAALNKYLMKPDVELLEAHRYIALMVKQDTGDRQSPWMSTNATPYVYFKMSNQTEARALGEWIAAQQVGEPYVRTYAELWSLGPYAASARKWLADNRSRSTAQRATQVSAAQVDSSWEVAKSASVSIPQVSGPLAMPRVASDTKTPLPDSSPQTMDAQNPQAVADLLARSKTVVVVNDLVARLEPKVKGAVAEALKPGAKIDVQAIEQDDSGGVWLRGKTADSPTPVYVQVPKSAGAQNVEIGRALREFTLDDAPLGTALLGDTAQIAKELLLLRTSGAKINWVSIATPAPDRERSVRDKAAIRARAYYVAFLIGKKVPPDKITMVEEAPDLHGENPRVRIFGSN